MGPQRFWNGGMHVQPDQPEQKQTGWWRPRGRPLSGIAFGLEFKSWDELATPNLPMGFISCCRLGE